MDDLPTPKRPSDERHGGAWGPLEPCPHGCPAVRSEALTAQFRETDCICEGTGYL